MRNVADLRRVGEGITASTNGKGWPNSVHRRNSRLSVEKVKTPNGMQRSNKVLSSTSTARGIADSFDLILREEPSTRAGGLRISSVSETACHAVPGWPHTRCGVYRHPLRQYGRKKAVLQAPQQVQEAFSMWHTNAEVSHIREQRPFAIDNARVP